MAIQTIGVPAEPLLQDDDAVDAIVIALKTRTLDPKDAIAQSLAALNWLKCNGAGQIYFKYCSTFDSTPIGKIGPQIAPGVPWCYAAANEFIKGGLHIA